VDTDRRRPDVTLRVKPDLNESGPVDAPHRAASRRRLYPGSGTNNPPVMVIKQGTIASATSGRAGPRHGAFGSPTRATRPNTAGPSPPGSIQSRVTFNPRLPPRGSTPGAPTTNPQTRRQTLQPWGRRTLCTTAAHRRAVRAATSAAPRVTITGSLGTAPPARPVRWTRPRTGVGWNMTGRASSTVRPRCTPGRPARILLRPRLRRQPGRPFATSRGAWLPTWNPDQLGPSTFHQA